MRSGFPVAELAWQAMEHCGAKVSQLQIPRQNHQRILMMKPQQSRQHQFLQKLLQHGGGVHVEDVHAGAQQH
jgi:hypothetical protein